MVEKQILIVFRTAALAIDVTAGAIIVAASVFALILYLRKLSQSLHTPAIMDDVRIRLGKSLSLALEFLIGADILKTVASPTLNEIGILASTIAVRVTLNYFLDRDVDQISRRLKESNGTP